MNDAVQSVEYLGRNKQGLEQVTITYRQSLISRLLHRRHERTFIKKRLIGWRDEVTGEQPTLHQYYLIHQALPENVEC